MKSLLNGMLLCVCCLVALAGADAPEALDLYNVIWTEPSTNSSESMPVGGHSIGLNVWVEDGDVLFYAQRSGSFTEHNEYHKLGRFRLTLDPNPFLNGADFRQELKLRQGYVEITGKMDGLKVEVDVWVEAERPVIHMDVKSHRDIDAMVAYEGWRNENLELTSERYGMRFGCFSWDSYPGEVIRYTDEVRHEQDKVLFYHRNRDDKLLIDYMIKQQGLEAVRDQMINTQKGRTFGGLLVADGFKNAGVGSGCYVKADYQAWKLKSTKSRKAHSIAVYTHVDQTDTLDAWMDGLNDLVESKSPDTQTARKSTIAWWQDFWNRSWLMIEAHQADPNSEAWQVGRNYQLFRYQLGCNYYGEFPTKFNGGDFTFDPSLTLQAGNPKQNFNPCPTPDWRSWGGGSFTAQNQRLLYWPMLKTGDFEAMLPQFEFYRRVLPNAKARVKTYWGHDGCLFTEQMENFGLPIACAWGWTEPDAKGRKRTPGTEHGVQVNSAVGYHYEAQLEFSFMIMEYHRYTGADISDYMEFIKQSVTFYDEHYQMRAKKRTDNPLDDQGKLIITPSTACESYKGAVNPVDACSGLQACLNALIALPEKYVCSVERAYFREVLKRVPDFSYDKVKGDTIIKPAHSWTHYHNAECPQFYPLFPFNCFELGVDDSDIKIFQNTWTHGTFPKKMVWSWHQDGIFYARMGMTDKAQWYNTLKLKDAPRRFPTFWGPGHDWVPDHNWGGSGMLGVQEMLMQTISNKIRLFPAWPKTWDVTFKLHAPQNTVVEGEFREGKVAVLKVTPESRRKDIVLYHSEN